mgnify:CR=1 FL=1|tara:strand:+ start:43 stop:336 length:294 start_codon:yes stop_codon:yes gene_type:complete
MKPGSISLYSFVIQGATSKKEIKNFLELFKLKYSITKSFIDTDCFNITLSGSNEEDMKRLIKISEFIHDMTNLGSLKKRGYLRYQKTLIEEWHKANI